MAWAPTTVDVAVILPTRTVNEFGVEQADFTDETRPTGDQVENLIARAQGDILGRVGVIPDGADSDAALVVEAYAKVAATYRAAMMVEITHFPEQINSGRSPYEELKALYDETILSLIDSLNDYNSSGEIDPGGNSTNAFPSYGFPEDDGGMIGWGTRW